MEDSNPNIHFEIVETPLYGGFSLISTNNYGYLFIGFILLAAFIAYVTLNTKNMENILDNIEKQIVLLKNSITFYKNQLLLKINMEGNAIKTTQPTSYSSFYKNGHSFS